MICETHHHDHESDAERAARLERLELLIVSDPRRLTRAEFAAVLPPRNPIGCPQNTERARVCTLLRAHRFRW